MINYIHRYKKENSVHFICTEVLCTDVCFARCIVWSCFGQYICGYLYN